MTDTDKSENSLSTCDNDDGDVSDASKTYIKISPKLIEALSPTGFMYGTLWPIIIKQATREQRVLCLCYVNQFFASVVRRIVSEDAKANYFALENCPFLAPKPVHLDLELLKTVDWAFWGVRHFEFKHIHNFRKFCALADVDPDKGAYQYDGRLHFRGISREPPGPHEIRWMFISRTRDVIFDTGARNPNLETDAYAHNFGITGRADKLKLLFQHVMDLWESGEVGWTYILWGTRKFI